MNATSFTYDIIEFETDAQSWPPRRSVTRFVGRLSFSKRHMARCTSRTANRNAVAAVAKETNMAGATAIMAERPLPFIATANLFMWFGTFEFLIGQVPMLHFVHCGN